ncbi:MAG: choice-of-anchor L domain-containing protein [Bacteroidetes bacterium]|nr:choice-of-anchor L domain-containing protein [Bacteroidota bacterium]MBS1943713.1 choice-of-anchor L domain-containing protein [Bacteroidota bacterium]
MTRNIAFAIAIATAAPAMAQLNVSVAMNPQQLVENVLLGGGVTATNVTYNGAVVTAPQAGSGSFTNGNTTNLGLDAGIILSSGLASNIPGPASYFGSDVLGTGSDPDLVAITTPGNTIQDKSVLEFDFVPNGDSLKFSYVFGSEEYPSFNCSANFNDVFGFFLSGPGINGPYTNNAINIALVPGTTLPVSIANIHGADGFGCPAANAQYYVNNANGTTISLNGFTTVLRAEAAVTCGQTYHIKLAIGDAGDEAYNSAVFLQAGSFASNVLPPVTAATFYGDATTAEGCMGGHFTIFRPPGTDSTYTIGYFMTGTATPGVDYTMPPSPAVIPAGQDSVLIPFAAIADDQAEGIETAIMNVFLVNQCGDTLVHSAMIAIIDYQPMEIHTETSFLLQCDHDSIPLSATVSGGFGPVSLAWGDTLHTGQVYVPGMANGTYTITARDACPREVVATIAVDAGCQVIIPNVITPNGDGLNDKFVVKGIEGRDNHVQLWDRWGKEVLNTSNYQNNFNAKGLHDGVYFYMIRVLEKEYHGNLQILGSK